MPDVAAFLELLYETLAKAGVQKPQCDFDEQRGVLVLNVGRGSSGISRVVPVLALAAKYETCSSQNAKADLMLRVAEAFGKGAADAPREFAACGSQLLPQVWPVGKILAMQMSLPDGVEIPHCGLHGETLTLKMPKDREAQELGVVLVYEYACGPHTAEPDTCTLPIETPVLTSDLTRWSVGFVDALRFALDNLRARTKSGPAPRERWEHHTSGCGQSTWNDRFDAARIALLPALVARRRRPDGQADPGGHVVAFATPSCVLASMSKNALGLCFLGDTLHTNVVTKEHASGGGQLLTTCPYRLLKMKANPDAADHPLNQKAGEGLVWRWLPYTPGGPPLRTSGEFSVPIDSDEVEAILNAVEAGRSIPVFAHEASDGRGSSKITFQEKKDEANNHFRAGNFVKAIAAYDAALKVSCPIPSDAEAAVAHANAAQALLKLAENDEPRREACAAEALRRAVRATELDPTYAKAHARCAIACEILGENSAAEEFRARAQACGAPGSATAPVKSDSSGASSSTCCPSDLDLSKATPTVSPAEAHGSKLEH